MSPTVEYNAISSALESQELFENKTWRLSPRAYALTPDELAQIEKIGSACLEFHKALENLYLKSVADRNILRNRELKAPWVAEYLERGKPDKVVAWNREAALRGAFPPVIRPDLIVSAEGFSVTEMDSVPGGIGLTAFLNRLYGEADREIVGREDRMLSGFYDALARLAPDRRSPLVTIVVSEEAATYRPEMLWLAEELRKLGKRVYCVRPEELFPLGSALNLDVDGSPEKVDVIYRFFELYDLENIPGIDFMLESVEAGEVVIAPPLRTFQEEKLSLALFHHHLLEEYWKENLSRAGRRVLSGLIPDSWVVDPVPLPPGAVFAGPTVGGRPLADWRDLGRASQKDRNLILKISGFHESAEGARSVLLGSDCSREEWSEGIEEAIAHSSSNPYILQRYRKPVRTRHPIYAEGDRVEEREGRTRLCPYFFNLGDHVRLGGILATFCPADKKIIHGMTDAALLPCRVGI